MGRRLSEQAALEQRRRERDPDGGAVVSMRIDVELVTEVDGEEIGEIILSVGGSWDRRLGEFDRDRTVAARAAEQFRATGAQGQQQLTQSIQNLLTTGGMQRAIKQAERAS